MGCDLEYYRARVGTWAGRCTWRGVFRHCDANGTTGDCLGLTVLSSMVLAMWRTSKDNLCILHVEVGSSE